MAVVTIHVGAKPRPVHPAWLQDVLADISNPDLRGAILNSKRFAERITGLLLGGRAATIPLPPADPALKRLAKVLGDDFLYRLGQLWLAPVLAEHVISPKGRIWPGLNDRHLLCLVLKYRNHAPRNAMGPMLPEPDFFLEGVNCVRIWLQEHNEKQISQRLTLILPPQSTEISSPDARLSFLDKALSDPDVTEGLKNA